jgi:hypothetical protein
MSNSHNYYTFYIGFKGVISPVGIEIIVVVDQYKE